MTCVEARPRPATSLIAITVATQDVIESGTLASIVTALFGLINSHEK